MPQTYRIHISGRVQGVGFRPYIYRLAVQEGWQGEVLNDGSGVLIYLQAAMEQVENALGLIQADPPKVAQITKVRWEKVPYRKFEGFQIAPSIASGKLQVPITPDFVLCPSCRVEIQEKSNKRYHYAFTTCIHCGPRYAVTSKYPFDRLNTSLSEFKMCLECQKEYENPKNRRFHSQTNSCSQCGISLWIKNNIGQAIFSNNPIQDIAVLIQQGAIVAIKNTNGYLLCCDAENTSAIQNLRLRKKRPHKPFALIFPSIGDVQAQFEVTEEETAALQSSQGPIVLLQNSTRTNIPTREIAPGLHRTGVMLPSSALLQLLVNAVGGPIVATSGNIHGGSIIADEGTAQEQLATIADYFLHHGLEIQFPQDDSVVKFAGSTPILLRRSRGYAPSHIQEFPSTNRRILAMGAHLKSTFTYIQEGMAYTSQYFGNLDDYTVTVRLEAMARKFISLFGPLPAVILTDSHPAYQSSQLGARLAREWGSKLVKIQHHKAHFASILGEHACFDKPERILGVIWDGTGLGEDGAIWGGEFLLYESGTISRVAHWKYFDWIVQDKMAREPRIALLCLLDPADRRDIKSKFTPTEWKLYTGLLQSNSLKTSSMGRLFDAVACLLDLGDLNSYEGELVMKLEEYALKGLKLKPIDYFKENNSQYLSPKELVCKISKDLKSGVSIEKLAGNFVYTLVQTIIRVADSCQVGTLACSGGVFQNAALVNCLQEAVASKGIKVLYHTLLSPNDENISFGQAMYYEYCNP